MIIIIIAIVLYIIGQLLVQNTGTKFYNHIKDKDLVIYDIIQNNTPDIYNKRIIVDIFAFVILLYSINVLSWTELYMFFKLFSVAAIIRSLTIQTTILPKYINNTSDSICQTIIKGGYDKFFSGHFSFSYLLLMFLDVGGPVKVFLNVFNAFLIVSSRRHYTIDIIGSAAISQLLWIYKDNILSFI